MKRLLGALLVASTLFFGGFVSSSQERESPDCAVVKDALEAVSHIKPGMTRADLTKDFTEDGGLQVRSPGRYLYKRCHLIKVNVSFRAATTAQEFSPNDVITEVSKPYLENEYMD